MAKKDDTAKIELKLRIPRDALPRLRRHRALDRWLAGSPSEERMVSTYFDTPDLHLLHRKIAVRDRKVGTRHVLSVKHTPKTEIGTHGRREWEAEIAKKKPDFRIIDDRALRKKLAADKIAGRLRPLFVADVNRAVWPLRIENSSIEFAIDVGEIKSRKHRLPVCEAGLELKSGDVGGVYALARELHKSVPFALEPLSTAERGYTLAADVAPKPHKATRLKIPRHATVGEAFFLIGRNGLTQLRANEACVRLKQDAEGIHQIRVAVRRLRSALSLFRDLVAEKERRDIMRRLKWIAKECAEAREWDVFEDESLAALHETFSSDPSYQGFTAAVDRLRRAADRRAADMLAGAHYTENVLEVGAWWDGGGWEKTATAIIAEPALKFAEGQIGKFHRRLCKSGDRIGDLDERGLHELRIRAKKLRYAIGFFGGVLPAKDVRAHLEVLAEIQDCLGALNDIAVARRLLARIETSAEGLDPTAFARAAGIVTGWNTARLEAGLKQLPKAWRRFADLRPFWK